MTCIDYKSLQPENFMGHIKVNTTTAPINQNMKRLQHTHDHMLIKQLRCQTFGQCVSYHNLLCTDMLNNSLCLFNLIPYHQIFSLNMLRATRRLDPSRILE